MGLHTISGRVRRDNHRTQQRLTIKVAEIFCELGIKLSGTSKTDLGEFERQLVAIANAAKQAAAALAQLSAARIPRNLRTTTAASGSASTTAAAQPRPTGTVITPNNPNFIGPTQPASPTSTPASQQQQWARFAAFGLKVLGIATLVVAIKKLVSTITNWVKSSVAAAVSTELFTRQTGLSRKSMKEWELAATKAGLAEGEAAQAMESFKQKWQHMRMTGEGAGPFQMLGIDPSADPEQIFRRFQERTKQMSEAEAVYFGTLLGFSKDFAAFLHSQKGEIRRFQDEVLTDKEQKKLTDLNAVWVDLSTTLGQVRDKLISDLAPGMRDWIKLIDDTARKLLKPETREKVYDFFDKLGDVLDSPRAGSIRTPDNRPFFGPPLPGNGATVTINQDISVDASGSKDPAAVKSAVRQALDKSASSAYYQRFQLLGGPQPVSP